MTGQTRSLIVGHGGREGALGARMAEHSHLFAYMKHKNPTLVDLAAGSGGLAEIGDPCDPAAVAAFAVRNRIDIAMVSADDPLAAGVVDSLQAAGIPTVGPTRDGAQIEWDKAFARSIVEEIAPEMNPLHFVVRTPAELRRALAQFGGRPVAVKPSGLTGGKGVKVMGPHLKSLADAEAYASALLQTSQFGNSVIIEERVEGIEFTIQAITDGHTVVRPPATYDYPYRRDGDKGPGTGGMGSFCVEEEALPFMRPSDYDRAYEVVYHVIHYLRALGRKFDGVLNSGFFLTRSGLRVIEFNARFGDPECLNIMSLFDGNWIEVMRRIVEGRLREDDVPFRRESSVVVYLVAPEYAYKAGPQRQFRLDVDAVRDSDCEIFFSSAERVRRDLYRTIGTSRVAAVSATGPSLEAAHDKVFGCIERSVPEDELDYRRDIASPEYVARLRQAAA